MTTVKINGIETSINNPKWSKDTYEDFKANQYKDVNITISDNLEAKKK